MKKTFMFMKTLLVAAGLLVGGSAWGQTTTTLMEYGTNDAPWTTTNIADWTGKTLILADDNSYVQYTGTDNGDFANTKTISPTAGNIINVTAVWRGRSNTGRSWSENAGMYFRFGNIVVAQNDQNQQHGYVFTGISNLKNVTTFAAGSYRTDIANCPWLKIEAEINTTTNTLTSFTVKSEDGNTTFVSLTNVALSDPDYTTVAFGFQRGGRHTTGKQEQLKSIIITETTQAATYADYIVHFVDNNGDKVKEDVVRNGEVGTTVNANSDDITTYYNGGYKYVYDNDGEGVEVKSDGSAELTITYTKYGQFTYTVNAVDNDNNILAELATATVYEGESSTLKWNKYVLIDEKWYYTTETTFQLTATEAGTRSVKYQSSDIAYFFEMENLTRSGGLFLTEESSSYSNGARLRISRGSLHYTPALAGGVYLLNIGCANSNASSNDVYVYTRSSEGTLSDKLYTHTATNGNTTLSYVITVPDGYSIAFNGNEGGSANNNARMDYMTLKRINTMSIVGDFSENGWDAANGIAMTQDTENTDIWTAVVNDYIVTSAKYAFQYKAVANGNWSDYVLGNPNASNDDKNQEYNFDYAGAGEGIYTLTFTVNTTNNSVEMSIEKQPTATIYFINTNDWAAENIKAWVWDANNGNYNYTGGKWPGQTMTATGEQIDGKDVYSWSTYVLNPTPTNLIISNNGSDTERTGDQAFVDGAYYKADGSKVTVSKTISAAGYATYYSDKALNFAGTGLTAYIAKAGETKDIEFVEVASVPANTGVLLKGDEGSYDIPVIASADEVIGNLFEGVLENTEKDAGIFVLMASPEVGFYKTTNAFTVGANTAYIPADAVEGRSFIAIDDDNTTSISNVNVNLNDNMVYNLRGQRVAQPTKGLYIVNGKKVVIK